MRRHYLFVGLDRVFRALLVWLLVLMVASVAWQIISRYFLASPSLWTEELSRFLLIWLGLLGGSYAYSNGMHLGLDLLGPRLTVAARRRQQFAIHGLVIGFAAVVLIKGGIELVLLTHQLGQHSPSLDISLAVIYLSLPISGIMFTVYGLLNISEIVWPQSRSLQEHSHD